MEKGGAAPGSPKQRPERKAFFGLALIILGGTGLFLSKPALACVLSGFDASAITSVRRVAFLMLGAGLLLLWGYFFSPRP